VHGRSIVHAVAQEPDDVSRLLERPDDPLFLIGIDLDEQVRLLCRRPETVLVKGGQIASWVAARALSPVMSLSFTPSRDSCSRVAATSARGRSKNVRNP